MARETKDREDLLRDATAFVARVQLSISRGERSDLIFAGFRAEGAASIYFAQDPVYHFNSTCQLRRALVDNVLVAAENGRLVVLRRQFTNTAVTMLRQEMSVDEQQKFCQMAASRLGGLSRAIAQGDFIVAGQVPTDADVVNRLVAFLERSDQIEVAASPHVGR